MQAQYPRITGIIKVTNFDQKYYFLACSKCNRAIDTYGDMVMENSSATIAVKRSRHYQHKLSYSYKSSSTTHNSCIRNSHFGNLKFDIQITDFTGSITTIIFGKEAA